jgi:hypothetical protein
MTGFRTFLRRALVVALLLSTSAIAHEGHDHDAPAKAVAGDPARPRFAASSDLFELVGMVDGQRLTLWLDRFSDNVPLTGASIELDVGDERVAVRADGDRYVGDLARPLTGTTIAITATIVHEKASDLLAADLVLPAAANGAPGAMREPERPAGLFDPRLVAVALGSALVAGIVGWVAGRGRSRRTEGGVR